MSSEWQNIQQHLEKRLNPGIFQLWIKPVSGVLQDGHLMLTAPSDFVASWIRDRLKDVIEQAAVEVLGKSVSTSIRTSSVEPTSPLPALAPSSTREHSIALPLNYNPCSGQAIAWRYNFDEFVVGQCNELAYAACTSLCRDNFPADHLFLSSAPGLGKTHLIQAIGHYVATERKQVRVGYVSAEEFGNQMVISLKAREIDRFKARYRESFDVLLIEDIQFFQGKEKMQEELLSTLKYLQAHGRKVVFTSSFLPKELARVDCQLTSQFCSGFLAVIQKPDFGLRLRIIEAKASSMQVQIPEDVSHFVAQNLCSDIRQLESCIRSMAIKARLLKQRISMELAREILGNYIRENARPDIHAIIRFISDSFGLPTDHLRSKSKKQTIVMARNTAFYLARKFTDLSLKDIGGHFNRRHSTVVKGISRVERELSKESSVGRQLQRIVERLES
jgi:chromosomal replication initiator protein